MRQNDESLNSLLTLYGSGNRIISNSDLPAARVSDILASIFIPGEYYYFITNFFDVSFEYVHDTIEKVIGYKPDEFRLEQLFECMHPDDAQQLQLKEAAALKFFFHRIHVSRIPLYKSTYTFRLRNPKGGWKNILHQSIAIQVTEGRIHRSLVVHTDITHLHSVPDNRISFIGINGEPSYYSLSTDPEHILEPEENWTLSEREREIIKLMADGYGSKQIADYLFISSHTVDTHRRNLLKKTGTKNTVELTAACLKKGLL